MAGPPIDPNTGLPDDDLDDDALSWEGDEELGRGTSLTEVRRGSRGSSRALRGGGPADSGADTEPDAALLDADAGDADGGDDPARDDPARDIPRTIGTVAFGILFLAYTVGWILTVVGVGDEIGVNTGVAVLDFAGRITQFLGLISAALWFVAVLQLTRDSLTRFRMGWLAVGAALLVPWPAVLGYLS